MIRLILLITVLSLAACSTNQADPYEFAGQYKDRFATQIKGQDIKLFTYKAHLANSSTRGLNDNRNSPQINRKNQDAISYAREQAAKQDHLERWQQNVELGLVNTLAMSGFCQTGYIELSRYIGADRAEIRGECKEGATQADIVKFGY
ncbi:hypothetical protein ACFOD0_00055 [Shewanella intestini]|uniref:Lipoprotein n=1 Tax=Shewanella intestini TaxID=2017544 RepID=A0ABS5I670_9GAMM|nr:MULTISPECIES: hypothetical protein [Shewanella]MBR9729507.1 hypothetical protein [Shewanella intestini]MRG37564.1 hypothetical protein [Shewanella sp. XMDDZSB0408]